MNCSGWNENVVRVYRLVVRNVCIRFRRGDTADSETMGTGPYSSKLEDGGSIFIRNTDVKYIHIGCQSAEDYTLANPRRENFKSDTISMCLLAAVVLHTKCAYICTEVRLSTRRS
jgi:hypothetical protein